MVPTLLIASSTTLFTTSPIISFSESHRDSFSTSFSSSESITSFSESES